MLHQAQRIQAYGIIPLELAYSSSIQPEGQLKRQHQLTLITYVHKPVNLAPYRNGPAPLKLPTPYTLYI